MTRALALLCLVALTGCPAAPTQPGPPESDAPASPSTSELSLSASTVASGESVLLTLTARDEEGHTTSVAPATITLAAAQGTSTVEIGAIEDAGGGRYQATVVGVLAGSPVELSAALAGAPVTTARPQLTVVPGSASPATSTVSASREEVFEGGTATVSLVTRDVAGNALTQGGRTVAFALTGGTSLGSFGAVVDHGDGTYSVPFTGEVAGTTGTVVATLDGAPVTSSPVSLRVVASDVSLSQSSLVAPASRVAGGGSLLVTLVTRDEEGAQLTDGGLTIAFTASAGTSTGSFGPVTDHGDGTYSASFTGEVAGTALSIGATVGGRAIDATLSLQVVPGPARALYSTVEVDTPEVVASTSLADGATARVTLRDIVGNVTTQGAVLQFLHEGGTSTGVFSRVERQSDGTYTSVFSGRTAGEPTEIRVTVAGEDIPPPRPTVTVRPAPFSAASSTLTASVNPVPATMETVLELRTTDAFGNVVDALSDLTITSTGATTAGSFGPTTEVSPGVFRCTFTAQKASAPFTIGVQDSAGAWVGPTLSLDVNGGPAAPGKSIFMVARNEVKVGGQLTVEVQTFDVNDDPSEVGGASVTMSFGSSGGTLGPVTDHQDGTYSALLTGVAAGTSGTLSGTVNGVALSGPAVSVVAPGGVHFQQVIDLLPYGKSIDLDEDIAGTTFLLDTDDFDGEVTYEVEVQASNTDANFSQHVRLVDETDAVLSEFNWAPRESGRKRATFVPKPGSHTYRLTMSTSVQGGYFKVTLGRLYLSQTNATRTRIWYPLVHGYNHATDWRTPNMPNTKSTTYTAGDPRYLGSFYKDSSRWSRLAPGTPWRFEMVGSADVVLINRDSGAEVAGTRLQGSDHQSRAAYRRVELADDAENFSERGVFQIRYRSRSGNERQVHRAMLSMKLDLLDHAETCLFQARRTNLSAGSTNVTLSPGLSFRPGSYSNYDLYYQAEAGPDITDIALRYFQGGAWSGTQALANPVDARWRTKVSVKPSEADTPLQSTASNPSAQLDAVTYAATCAAFY